MKIIEKEINALTGEETFTERNMTADEIAERQAAETEYAALLAAENKKQSDKATALLKLAALGLTIDDLAALGF